MEHWRMSARRVRCWRTVRTVERGRGASRSKLTERSLVRHFAEPSFDVQKYGRHATLEVQRYRNVCVKTDDRVDSGSASNICPR